MRGVSGMLLIAFGVSHTIFGILAGPRVFARIAQMQLISDGAQKLVTGVTRQFAFWFFFSGILIAVLGHLCVWVERRLHRPVPEFVGWELLLLSVVGAVLVGVDLWLVVPVALYIVVVDRRAKAMSATTQD